MRARLPTIAAVVVTLGGCAAAVPGYQPPTPKLEKYQATVQKGGGFEGDGRYQLSEQELALNCKQLNGSITIKIIQMRRAGERQKPSAVAQVAQKTARPLVGGTQYGADLAADTRRDRARLEALNRQLATKNCPTFDLEAELAPGNQARPAPKKAEGKKG